MRDAAAVADDVKPVVAGHEVAVHLDLHVIELHFHAVEQRVVVGSAGGDFIQRVNHLNDAVQNALGQHEAQVARGGVQRRHGERLLDALLGAALAADEVAEALDDNAAAQHVAQAGNALAVAVGILERLREMLGDQQREIRVVRLFCGILVAVTVHSYNPIRVFVDDNAPGVHAEGTYRVFILFGAVDDFAFIQFVGQVRENLGRQFHADTNINAVGIRLDVKVFTDFFHPLAAAASGGNNALAPLKEFVAAVNAIAVVRLFYRVDGAVKMELHLFLQMVVKVLEHNIVNVRSEVANGSVQQVQTVLHTGFFQARAGGRIELRALAAVAQIDSINIFHEFRGSLFADVLVERAAEIVGDVVLAIGECARAAKAAHDGAALAVDAGFHFLAVNRTLPAVERVPRFKNGDFQVRSAFHQFISGKNSSGASTNNEHIVHRNSSIKSCSGVADRDISPFCKHIATILLYHTAALVASA